MVQTVHQSKVGRYVMESGKGVNGQERGGETETKTEKEKEKEMWSTSPRIHPVPTQQELPANVELDS